MNILITGAGRGLGLELAAEALERGHAVFAGMRSPHDKSPALQALEAAVPGKLICVRLDVTDEAGIAELAASLKKEGVQLGSIVNNAAVLEARNTAIEELDMKDVELSFDINLYGPMRVVKHLLPLLREPEASVVNISSEAGSLTNAYPGDYPYAITKAALNMFTEQLRKLLAERGVQALSVHPGWIRTDMGGESAPTDPRRSAAGILDLIERKVVPVAKFHFVDYTGNEMQI
jgi:NAD(P)-dependent dehydrogenase (short-subunit alcohol dehydrogenase family)